MKCWAIGLLAAALSTAAMADPAPSFSWSGLYGGISGGWSTADRDWAYTSGGATSNKDGMESGVWSGHLGLQQQFGGWVFGVEANLGSINKWGTAPCPNSTISCESRISNFWSIGPRVGYVWNNVLWYATGGYAQAGIETHARTALSIYEQTSERHDGRFIGAGAEYPIARNLFVGIEYQHQDYGKKLHTETTFGGISNRDVKMDVDLIRARLTWKFGAPFSPN